MVGWRMRSDRLWPLERTGIRKKKAGDVVDDGTCESQGSQGKQTISVLRYVTGGKIARILWKGDKMDHSHPNRTDPDHTRPQGKVDQDVPIFYTAHPNKQTHSKEIEVSMSLPTPSIHFINHKKISTQNVPSSPKKLNRTNELS